MGFDACHEIPLSSLICRAMLGALQVWQSATTPYCGYRMYTCPRPSAAIEGSHWSPLRYPTRCCGANSPTANAVWTAKTNRISSAVLCTVLDRELFRLVCKSTEWPFNDLVGLYLDSRSASIVCWLFHPRFTIL